jgi:hypothetical protein
VNYCPLKAVASGPGSRRVGVSLRGLPVRWLDNFDRRVGDIVRGRMYMRALLKLSVPAIYAAALCGCTTIAAYDEKAYENATSAKAEALTLVGKSNQSYTSHEQEVNALKLDMSKAAEFAKGIPKNDAVVGMYAIIMRDDKNDLGSLYGVLTLWKEKNTLHAAFTQEITTKIGEEFDQLIQLEQGKNKF